MSLKIIAETPRLLLREFIEDDAAAFFALCTDPQVIRYTGDPGGVKTVEDARRNLLERPIADYRKHGFGRWACIFKEDGNLIGFAGPKYLEELNEIDLGYRFLPAYWGMGLATEASQAVLDVGFSRFKLEEILGLVHPENTASHRVLAKLGFRYVGLMEYWDQPTARYDLRRPMT